MAYGSRTPSTLRSGFPASFIARLRRQREAAAARGGTADGQTAWPWELNEAYFMIPIGIVIDVIGIDIPKKYPTSTERKSMLRYF